MAKTKRAKVIANKLAALEQSLSDYLNLDNALAPRTLKDYRSSWTKWLEFCEQRGFTPLPAPIEAYQALLGAARNGNWAQHNQALTSGGLDRVLAAIKHHHRANGYTPACDQPQHSSSFSDALRGYRRSLTKPVRKAKEIDIPTLKQLLEAEPTETHFDRMWQAIGLLSLDHHIPLRTLLGLKPDEVHVQPDNSLFLTVGDGYDIPCNCATSSTGDQCLACLLAHLAEQDHPSGRVLCPRTGKQPLCQTLYSIEDLMHTQGNAWEGLTWQGNHLRFTTSDIDTQDKLRIVLTRYALKPGAIDRARTKMAVSVAFYAGLRAGSDLDGVRRSSIKPIKNGYRFTVTKSKTDQDGQGWDVGINHTKDPALDPVTHLDTWLLIRDHARGAQLDGPLVYPVGKGGRFLVVGAPSTMHRVLYQGFRNLQELAGVSGYSLHSLRRGFATEALKQGIDIEEIQHTMRHVALDRTASYAGPAGSHAVLEALGRKL